MPYGSLQHTPTFRCAPTAALFLSWQDHLPTSLYGAFRVTLLLEIAPKLYFIPLGIAFWSVLYCLSQTRLRQSPIALALILLIVGGCAPTSPLNMLFLTLGASLIATLSSTSQKGALA